MIGVPKVSLTSCCNRPYWDSRTETIRLLVFSNLRFRDYFAAVYLANIAEDPRELGRVQAGSDRERWLYPFILLLGIAPQAAGLFDTFFGDVPCVGGRRLVRA